MRIASAAGSNRAKEREGGERSCMKEENVSLGCCGVSFGGVLVVKTPGSAAVGVGVTRAVGRREDLPGWGGGGKRSRGRGRQWVFVVKQLTVEGSVKNPMRVL